MKRLVIIDFMYLAHRHMYAVREAENKKYNTALKNAAPGTEIPESAGYTLTNPNTGEESARLYYIIRDIETLLATYEGDDIVVCSDRHTTRKDNNTEQATDYKANRAQKFKDLDIAAIRNTENLIQQSGTSFIAVSGYEADDLIQSIVRTYKDEYDEILIYTPDSDLAVLIDDKVKLKRYKSVYSTGGAGNKHASFLYAHATVEKSNFSDYFSVEFSKKGPVIIDYNAMMLYKATVGDTTDSIKGISGFGNAAYSKLRTYLINQGFTQWNELSNPDKVEALLLKLRQAQYFNDKQYNQAIESLKLVQPYLFNVPKEILRPAPAPDERKAVYNATWGITRI